MLTGVPGTKPEELEVVDTRTYVSLKRDFAIKPQGLATAVAVRLVPFIDLPCVTEEISELRTTGSQLDYTSSFVRSNPNSCFLSTYLK